ncbi:hypothetical protein D3C72_2020860 [compost metagenome]
MQGGDLSGEVENGAFLIDVKGQAASGLGQGVQEGGLGAAADGVEGANVCAGFLEVLRHADDRRDADAAGQQQIAGQAGAQLEMAVGPGDLQPGAGVKRPHAL